MTHNALWTSENSDPTLGCEIVNAYSSPIHDPWRALVTKSFLMNNLVTNKSISEDTMVDKYTLILLIIEQLKFRAISTSEQPTLSSISCIFV